MTNLQIISQGLTGKDEEFNGFPLAVGLMNMVAKSYDLLQIKKKNPLLKAQNKYLKELPRY